MHEIFKQRNLPYLDIQECPNCHQNIPAYCKICPECNHDLTITKENTNIVNQQNDEINKPEITLCPNCNKPIDLDKDYCGHCGFKIKADKCLCCGEEIAIDLLFCPNCGNKKGTPATSSSYQQLNKVEEIKEPIKQEEVNDDIQQTENKKEENQKIVIHKDSIEKRARKYLSKKRIFTLFILLVILGVIATILFTNYISIDQFIHNDQTFAGPSSKLTGIDILTTFVNDLVTSSSIIPEHYKLDFGKDFSLFIFTSGWPSIINPYMPYVIIGLYVLVLFSLFIALLCNFIGMFSKKRFKTTSLGLSLLLYFIFNIVNITHMICLYLLKACNWSDFNSINLIVFAGFLLIWVITKISFIKNNKDIELLRYLADSEK